MGKLLTIIFSVSIIFSTPLNVFAWTKIKSGIEHSYFECENTKYHAVKVDPYKVDFSTVVYKPNGRYSNDVLIQQDADVVINGSFFTPEQLPIGLIINNGIQLSKIHKTSWWSIFYIENEKPKISLARDIADISSVRFAVQAGPRLIIDKKIPNFKNKIEITSRSAIGIDKYNNVVLAISKSGLTNASFAKCLLQTSPKGPQLVNAMNLDGGSSSQMSLKIKDEILNDSGIVPVPNYIVIKSK